MVLVLVGFGKIFVMVEWILDKFLRGVLIDFLFILIFIVKVVGEFKECLEKKINEFLKFVELDDLK